MPAVDAASNALTTVARVLAHMREPASTDGTKEDTIQFLINSYSESIELYCRRQFVAEPDVAKEFSYDGSGFLSLAPFELQKPTSGSTPITVTFYTDLVEANWHVLSNQSATSEADWRPNPRQGTKWGTYYWLTLPEIGRFNPYLQEPLQRRRNLEHQVTISGDWGCQTTPGIAALGCVIAVANAYRNPESFQTAQSGSFGFTEDTTGGAGGDETGMNLPRDVRALLIPLRRKGRG